MVAFYLSSFPESDRVSRTHDIGSNIVALSLLLLVCPRFGPGRGNGLVIYNHCDPASFPTRKRGGR